METADEREARGHPVGQATPYAAMGGLTGFSSLAEGYMRLDPSGMGKTLLHTFQSYYVTIVIQTSKLCNTGFMELSPLNILLIKNIIFIKTKGMQ